MKRLNTLSLAFALLFVFGSGNAQPIIPIDIWLVQGDLVEVKRILPGGIDEGPAGANQSWDFSNISIDTTDPDFFWEALDPATTAEASSFSDADIAVYIPPRGDLVYYRTVGETVESVGMVTAPIDSIGFPSLVIPYDDAELSGTFPLEYDKSVGPESFSGSYTLDYDSIPFALDFERFGTSSCNCDAYGTLTLPNGTWDDVLRCRWDLMATDSSSFSKSVTHSWSYLWYEADTKLWLFAIYYNEMLEPISGPISKQVFYNENAIMVANEEVATTSFEIFPNPIMSGQDLQLVFPESLSGNLQLFTALGQLVQEETIAISADTPFQWPLSETLPAGLYTLRLQSADQQMMQKILIQTSR